LLAVAPITWENALRAGPNAFHLFLAALLLVLLLAWGHRQRQAGPHAGRWLVAAALVFGLSLGNHGLTILLAPGVAAYVLLVAPRILWQQWRLVLACIAVLVATTVLVYAYIPLRASMDPPLNYAVPTTWERFRYLVFGEQFRSTFHPLPPLPEVLDTIWGQLWENLGVASLAALAGVVVGALRHPRVVVLTGLWFVLTWVFALAYETADIERYYLVPLLVATIWAALALDGLWDGIVRLWTLAGRQPVESPDPSAGAAAPAARDAGGSQHGAGFRPSLAGVRAALSALVALVLLLPVLAPVAARADRLDQSQDSAAARWLDATLAALPRDAVVVSWWSNSTPLWYGRWVEGRRPDVTIIDDRTVMDEGYGSAERVVERFLGQRPVFVVRYEPDLPEWRRQFVLEPVEGIPWGGALYRVVSRASDG
jgi:hypothetical protein